MDIFGEPFVCLPQSHMESKVKAMPNYKISMKKSDEMLNLSIITTSTFKEMKHNIFFQKSYPWQPLLGGALCASHLWLLDSPALTKVLLRGLMEGGRQDCVP